MPVLPSSYVAPGPLWTNGHVQTLWASKARRVERVPFERERIDTTDEDFLDLDWLRPHDAVAPAQEGERLVVLSHGLEGSTARTYVHGMARALHEAGWSVLAWNLRGCSGEPNRLLHFYHSGATYDLDAVVQHALGRGFDEVALVGFSLGGNLTLKYLGERGEDAPVTRAVAFSTPCDLAASSLTLAEPQNLLYMQYFLTSLRAKVRLKAERYPGQISDAGAWSIRTFRDFDGRYTAPLHGFASAEDYWQRASCKPFLQDIHVPTLLVQAADDPFLPAACYPYDEARASDHLTLEVPRHGGHVGFVQPGERYWSEERAVAFLEE